MALYDKGNKWMILCHFLHLLKHAWLWTSVINIKFIAGKVIPTCKLFVSGSALEDLKRKQVHPPERCCPSTRTCLTVHDITFQGRSFSSDLFTCTSFRFDISQREKSVGVMLKSDSEPFLSKLQMNPCDESFTKEQNTQKDVKGLYLLFKVICFSIWMVVIKLFLHFSQISSCQMISLLLIICVSLQEIDPHWRPNCPDWRPYLLPTLLVALREMPSLKRPCSGIYNQFYMWLSATAFTLLLLFLRLCAYFKTPPGAISKALHTYADIPEQFEKAPFSRWQVTTVKEWWAKWHRGSD